MAIERDNAFDVDESGFISEGGAHNSSGSGAPAHSAEEGDIYPRLDGSLWRYVEGAWVEQLHGSFRNSAQVPTYLGNGELDFIEFFIGLTKTTPNRRTRVDFTYDGSLNLLTEVWKYYDPADGTTVLKTYTLTHAWSGTDYVDTEGVLS